MIKLLLYPFSLLYGVGVYFRNQMYDLNLLKSREFDVPVISVGNISVGGTGKTPHVEYLAALLKEKFGVATLSRGYKRKSTGFHTVEATSTVAEVGDEPLQIKRKFPEITVAVCENRVTGVEVLVDPAKGKMPDVILLDDAFQHRRITPGINILLIDYNRPLKEDMLLPAGRLRERPHQMRRANVIIFTKCPGAITPIMRRILQKEVQLKPYQELFFSTLHYGKVTPLFNAPALSDSFYSSKTWTILAVTGVATPGPIPAYLKQFSSRVDLLSFPDHHNYTESDVQQIRSRFEALRAEKRIIITTEKDAVRLTELPFLDDDLKRVIYYLPVEVQFLDEEAKMFNKKIINYVGENKSNRELYQRTNKNSS
jgi:tetraacyldisaccharide 4'-kinase